MKTAIRELTHLKKPLVYDYQSFSDLLSAWLSWLKESNAKFSLRWVAKRIGLLSHTHLLRLMNGEKQPSDDILTKIAALMELTVDEFAFMRALAELSRAKRTSDREFALDKIAGLRRSFPDILLEIEAFDMIAHWHHLAIFEMTILPDFQDDPEWISRRLNGTISVDMAKDSLLRLEKIGLIKNTSGKFERSIDQFNTTHNVPSTAIRAFHAEMLNKALYALNGIPVSQRYFFGHTMALDSKKLEQAANLMIEFRGRFHKLMGGSAPDSIYHLGMQLIPLTKVDHEAGDQN